MHTPECSLEALAIRVAKLETQNSRLKKAGIVALLVAAAVVSMGQAPAKKIITANEFVLQDASGTARARLSMEMTDRPTLSFYKDKTTLVASLAAGDEPFLSLQRVGTPEQVQLGAKKEWVGLAIYEKEIRAGVSVQKGIAALDVFDEKGKPQASLTSSGVVAGIPLDPGLNIHDTNSPASLSIEISPSGAGPSFSMYDSTGQKRIGFAVPNGAPSLRLTDKEGFSTTLGSADLLVPSTGRKESTSAASIVLFGKDQKVLWSAP